MSPSGIIALTAAITAAVSVAIVWVVWRFVRPSARQLAEVQELRKAVAELMSDLTPAQLEAAQVFAWAAKSGWNTVNYQIRYRHPVETYRYVNQALEITPEP